MRRAASSSSSLGRRSPRRLCSHSPHQFQQRHVGLFAALAQPSAADPGRSTPRGGGSRLILLAVEGAPADTLAALSKAMAKDLRADPAFGVVSNGEEEGFARDRDLLWRNRYLLSPAIAPEHFDPAALHAALEADLGLLGSELGVLAKRSIPADPTGEMLRLIGCIQCADTSRDARRGMGSSDNDERC